MLGQSLFRRANKTISIILSVMIIFSLVMDSGCFFENSLRSFAATAGSIKIKFPNVNIKAGEKARFNIELDSIPSGGVSSGRLQLLFETSKFSGVSVSPGAIIDDPALDFETKVQKKNLGINVNGKDVFSEFWTVQVIYIHFDILDENFIKRKGIFCTLELTANSNIPSEQIQLKPRFTSEEDYTSDPENAFYSIPNLNSNPDPVLLNPQYTFGVINITGNATPSPSPSPSPSPTPTVKPIETPTITPTHTPTPTMNPSATHTPTLNPSATSTPTPTATPSAQHTTISNQPSPMPSAVIKIEKKEKKFNKVVKIKIGDQNILVNEEKETIDPDKENVPWFEGADIMLPVRGMVDILGGELQFSNNKSKAIVSITNRKCEVIAEEPAIMINGEKKKMKGKPRMKDNILYVPLSYLAIIEKCIVEWDWDQKVIIIRK